ncbi:MAG: hypothetical protein JST93_26480 [Acidobacteria bacterium]|nr:hypothetical protein [Acidobacteriota bacterium]
MKLSLGLFLALLGAVSSAHAAPVLYSIQFTATIGAVPSSGSFRYDPDVPVFSDFIIVWAGNTIDMTAGANNPGTAIGACDTPGNGAADTFDFLLNQNCGSGLFFNGWSASRTPGSTQFRFQRLDQIASPVDKILVIGFAGQGNLLNANGAFSISLAEAPVPEPATFSMVTAAAALIAACFRVRRSGSA